jgi:hypothetical protein
VCRSVVSGTHIDRKVLLVTIVKPAWVDYSRLFSLPPILSGETLVPLDRHHSVEFTLDPLDVDTLRNQIASGEPEPFFAVTKFDLGIERFQHAEVPFRVVAEFLLPLYVLRRRRDRFVPGLDQELRDLGVLEMVSDVERRVVEVTESINPRCREND